MKNMKRECAKKTRFKFNIVEVYPKTAKEKNEGTFHAYWVEGGIDFRGIYYMIQDGKPWVRIPSKKYVDGGVNKYFLFFSFSDREKTKSFIHSLRYSLELYLKEKGVIKKSLNPNKENVQWHKKNEKIDVTKKRTSPFAFKNIN